MDERLKPKLNLNQIALLPKLLTRHERHTALALVALCLISSSILAVRWYNRNTVLLPTLGGEYTEAIVGTPRTANPLLAATPAEFDLATLTYRGLMKRTATGELVPDLAETVKINPEQTTYELTLRPNLLWSDGIPLTSADVAFTYSITQDKILGSPRQNALYGVSVETKGNTVLVKLKEPYTEFLANLTLGIIPRHVWQNIPTNTWLENEANLKPIGTGPFRYKSLSYDRQGELKGVTLEPNPYTHTKPSSLKKFSLRFYPDLEGALDALQHGLAQSAGAFSRVISTNLNSGRFINYEIKLPQYTALLYRSEASVALKETKVRQALGLALSRTNIITNAINGNATPLASLPDAPGTKNSLPGATNLDEATKLMTSAGYKHEGGKWQLQEVPLELTLTFSDTTKQKKIAQEVTEQWESFGVTVKNRAIPTYQFARDVLEPRNFEVLLISETIGLDLDLYPFWHSSQSIAPGVNLSGFKNQTADKLMVELRQTANTQTKLELYQKLQQLLATESPATFLFSTTYNLTMAREVRGFTVERMAEPAGRFVQVEDWYMATVRSWK